MKKRHVVILTMLLILVVCSVAEAENFWQMYWKPGECKVSFTPEDDALVTGILEEAKARSEGTIQRQAADESESVEAQYERFLEMNPEGTPMGSDEIMFDDIGYYQWAVGLPDEQSISRDEAWRIMVKFMLDQQIATKEILIHYYPQVAYETGNDPENPVWRILPLCYDYQESGLPFSPYEIAIYAHDGSICGYRVSEESSEDESYQWSDPNGKYLSAMLSPVRDIRDEEEAAAYAKELWQMMNANPLPEGKWEILLDQHDNSWHCSVYDEHMVGLYGASFLNNGVIQQILDSVPDPARDTEGVRKAGSELEAEKWEQAKEQISKWLNKAAPGILNLVEPMIVDSVIEVADKQYLVIHADPLNSEITSGLNLVVILYADGHCDIKEYSCYGAG